MQFLARFGKDSIKNILLGFGVIILALLPLIIKSGYVRHIMAMIYIYAILSISLNLIAGISGQLSLGHAAFYGLGAYTSALLTMRLDFPFLLSLLMAAIVAGMFGIALGLPCLRLSGDYLCIVTIGFAEIIRLFFQNWTSLTNGPMGIPGIPAIKIFSYAFKSDLDYIYLFLIALILIYIAIERILDSQIGRALIAIREDEVAANAMGVNMTYYKVLAFVLGSVIAGVAGSFMAHYISFIGPMNFTVDESLLVLQMVILGGLGSSIGAFVGAAILVIAPEVLRIISEYRMLFNGLLMVILMIWRPQGLFGSVGGRGKNDFFKKHLPWLAQDKVRDNDAETPNAGITTRDSDCMAGVENR